MKVNLELLSKLNTTGVELFALNKNSYNLTANYFNHKHKKKIKILHLEDNSLQLLFKSDVCKKIKVISEIVLEIVSDITINNSKNKNVILERSREYSTNSESSNDSLEFSNIFNKKKEKNEDIDTKEFTKKNLDEFIPSSEEELEIVSCESNEKEPLNLYNKNGFSSSDLSTSKRSLTFSEIEKNYNLLIENALNLSISQKDLSRMSSLRNNNLNISNKTNDQMIIVDSLYKKENSNISPLIK